MRSLSRRSWAHEKVRFLLVGLVNTGFGYGVFAALVLTAGQLLHYLVVLLIAHVLGVLEAFVLHRWLTFRVRGRVLGDLMRFWGVYLVALLANIALLPVLVELIGLPVLVAQAVALLVLAVGSYVGHKRFSFRRPVSSQVTVPSP